ncbi:MAG: diguanylate cyclase [Steroidobacteraceae bacterium]
MSEASDWKQKYRDSLLEMETEEQRWRQVEQALRRLVGRLCAAGMGVDPKLDDELITLAAANRRNADAAELERLAESLTTAVVAVDAVSPVPTIVLSAPALKRWESTCTAAGKILLCVQTLAPEHATAKELLAHLGKAQSDGELAAILEKTAEVIRTCGDALAHERLQAAAVLAEVTARLEEMAGYLTASGDEARSRFTDTASVNESVMSQVRELTAEAKSATELRALQNLVTARLETVSRQVLDFRAREEQRLLEETGRADRMRSRIEDLEREAQDLHSKLDREKYGARHDPLTLVGNRKSFDERFAQAMALRAENEVPVAMLLWDLDNFKVINDTYGHRAGDRVLKTVATCFVSGLRPEDFIARIGGEEFVMLLAGLPFAKAQQIAEELRQAVAALRFHFRGSPVRITSSCGLTDLRTGDTGSTAFDRADGALYRAKHGGKNLCVAG